MQDIYISYYDRSISGFTALTAENGDKYDNIYYYDGSRGLYDEEFESHTLKEAAVYEVKASDQETIGAVGFVTISTDLDYTVSIFLNPTDADNPESGSKVVNSSGTTDEKNGILARGKTDLAGYYSVPLTSVPSVKRGDTFAVVVTLSSSENIKTFVGKSYSGGKESYYEYVEPGQTYYNTGDTWKDAYDRNMTMRVRAYTSNFGWSIEGTELMGSGDDCYIPMDYSGTDVTKKIRLSGDTKDVSVSLPTEASGYLTVALNAAKDEITLTAKSFSLTDHVFDLEISDNYNTQFVKVCIRYDISKLDVYLNTVLQTLNTSGIYGGTTGTLLVPYDPAEDKEIVLKLGGVDVSAESANYLVCNKVSYEGNKNFNYRFRAAPKEDAINSDYPFFGEMVIDYSYDKYNLSGLSSKKLDITSKDTDGDGYADEITGISILPTDADPREINLDELSITAVKDTAGSETDFTITAKSESEYYTGTYSVSVPMDKTDISSEDSAVIVELSASEFTYDGAVNNPTVTIYEDSDAKTAGTPLTLNVDYKLNYYNNVNASSERYQAHVVITGIGRFEGEKTEYYWINPFNLSTIAAGDVTINKNNPVEYTGYEIDPEVSITGLTQGEDYYVEFENNIKISTSSSKAKAVITGIGNYEGTRIIQFDIVQKALPNNAIKLNKTSFVYNGKKQLPSVAVRLNGKKLKTSDYTITWEKYNGSDYVTCSEDSVVNADNYRVKVDVNDSSLSAGNKTGYQEFEIVPKDISKIKKIEIARASQTVDYNPSGAMIPKENITVIDGIDGPSYSLVVAAPSDEDIDYKNDIATVTIYDNMAAGYGHVKVCGIGNYTGYVVKSFTIKGTDIGKVAFNTIPAQTIDKAGAHFGVKPEVTAVDGSVVENRDYTVSYANNTKVGTGTAIIQGINKYTGTKKITFKLGQTNIEDFNFSDTEDADKISCTLEYAENTVYNGTAITPKVSMQYKSNKYNATVAMKEGTDYKISYKDNKNAGTAKMTISGIGLYKGKITREFEIIPQQIDSSYVTATAPAMKLVANKDAKSTPVVYFTNGDNKKIKLTAGRDYEVSYPDADYRTAKANAKVKIKGKGNFDSDSWMELSYAISQDLASSLKITIDKDYSKVEYNGNPQRIDEGIHVFYKGEELSGSDYRLIYENNIAAGKATVTVECIPNAGNQYRLAGTKTANFTITPKPFIDSDKDETVDVDISSAYYFSGFALTPFEDGSANILDPDTGNTSLKLGTDYTVKYKSNTNVGTATITLTGKGSYKGTLTRQVDIVPIYFDSQHIDIETEACVYTGREVKPAVKVYYKSRGSKTAKDDRFLLKQGVAYRVNYANNEVCTHDALVTVTQIGGKQNFYTTRLSTVTGSYVIGQADISKATVSKINAQTYKGDALYPKVTIKLNGITLDEGEDYVLVYENNSAPGTANIYVYSRNTNIQGALNTTFEIK